MTWVLLLIFLGMMLLYLSMLFMIVALNDGTFTEGQVRMELLDAAQVAQYRLMLTFPGIFGAVFSQVNSIGGICAIILAAGSLGSEYNWGTLRLQLAREPRRGRYLLAKILGLLLILFVGILIALLLGVLLGLLCGAIFGRPGSVTARDLLLIPVGIVRALYVMLPYILFTYACCTLGRSVLAGAGGGLIFLALDISLGGVALFLNPDSPLALLYNLLLQQNINTLVVINSTSYGLDPAILVRSLDQSLLPSPVQAVLVVAFYSACFFASAYYWLTRRDVIGAT